MGLRLQGTVGELYTAATGYRLRAARGHYRHREHDWLVCHLDFRVWGSPFILVECKTRMRMNGWGEDGSGDVPKDVWAQCQHEMMVVGAQECHVAALFGLHTFRVYRIQRSDEFIEKLIPVLSDFWHEHVLKGVPPPPSGHDLDSAALQERHPDSGPFYRNVTPAQMAVVDELRLAVERAGAAALALEAAKNRVKDLIGPDLGLIGTFGTVTWKRTKDVEVVAWDDYGKALERLVKVLAEVAYRTGDQLALKRIAPELEAYESGALRELYTSTRPGQRRFTMEWAE
jgi:predicted phage-related endonuclease